MEGFAIATEKFAGPLEALLDLIEDRKMPVSEISLSEVCDAYLSYVERLPELPLAETSQFILVASTLLLIKSRTLLPALDLTVEERESVQELEDRLRQLAIVREAARGLKQIWGKEPIVLPRASPVSQTVFAPAEATREALLAAMKRLLSSIPERTALSQAAVKPVVALKDIMERLHERLKMAARARFSEIVGSKDAGSVIVHFLAVLELVRGGSASASQSALFGDIEIELESFASAPRYGA